ncbi:MAG: flagellar assembly protein FliW [Candidatus Kapabacteria bacterium]|nr:flagellar assembly protein FliW [Candidatus Kapabacteria bacterium]MCS7169946.1 flagellar assembly protein FliW [Candidatus Kapabacteria bacterium]MDW7997628.1 flagellar assembly protein FliW [Bacteroidota bacterium]
MRSKQQARSIQVPGLGSIRFQQKHIFTFPTGIIGFEHLKRYVLISSPELHPLRWLIAVEEPSIAFPVLLPWYVLPHYELPSEYSDLSTCVPLVIVTLAQDPAQIVVNLKAPILLNLRTRQGQQLILPGDRYSATHPLVSVQLAEQGDHVSAVSKSRRRNRH